MHNCFLLFIGKRTEERIGPLTGVIIKRIKDKGRLSARVCKKCRGWIQEIPVQPTTTEHLFARMILLYWQMPEQKDQQEPRAGFGQP